MTLAVAVVGLAVLFVSPDGEGTVLVRTAAAAVAVLALVAFALDVSG